MQTTRKPFLPPRWFIRAAWAVHRAMYAVSGGRFGLRKPSAKTYGMMRIHTTGRRTGGERALPHAGRSAPWIGQSCASSSPPCRRTQ